MSRIVLLACGLLSCWMVPLALAREPARSTLHPGARVGLVNVLDPEVAEYHASRILTDSFFKTRQMAWPIDTMLSDALGSRLAALQLTAVPVQPSDSLLRHRDEYFVNASVARGLTHELSQDLGKLAALSHLDAMIILAPGLNKSVQGATRKGPDYLRGWGYISGPGPRDASLFNMTQLLLVVNTADGTVLQGREWGGSFAEAWTDYAPAADPRELPAEQLDRLQSVFARVLAEQAGRLVERISVTP